ncbi:MAG TPA: hypothetical protein VHY35_08330 [Stellaceae bacterium]|jgi:hypothetical protein|nr:hypothetical protein [Stellaceae bacterium]
MAKTALNFLQDQIEAVRREAYAAGYAAAMQAVRDFAAKPTSGAEASPSEIQPRPAFGRRGRPVRTEAATVDMPRPRQSRGTSTVAVRAPRATASRPQRGTNAKLIEDILHSNAPRALRPAEIRTALRRDKGVAMAFTSIRHALGQLEARRTIEQIADSKTWRYCDGNGASAAMD